MVFASFEDLTVTLDSLLHKFSSTRKLFRIVAYMLSWTDILQQPRGYGIANIISAATMEKARLVWIKLAQRDLEKDLVLSMNADNKKLTVEGKFKRLAPFLDSDAVWRVGKRMREYVPFTRDHRPPALLPKNHRMTWLLMLDAHGKRHGGVSDTVATFRMMGYWVAHANDVAKAVRKSCVICRYLDHHPIGQLMGNLPSERLVEPVAWGQVELDLFGPFVCRSDVNKRSSKKIWGIVVVDINSNAVHCDIVLDYSAKEVVNALSRFISIRGHPS